LLSDIRKRSAAMAAAEMDEEDQDPVVNAEIIKSSSKKRKQMLNEAEVSLADSLGSDIPDDIPDYQDDTLSLHTDPPSSPSVGNEDWVGAQDPYDCKCFIL
jgi:hypothetical protein